MKPRDITFGSDPEMAVVEKGTNNLVPPEFMIAEMGLKPVDIDVNKFRVRHPIFVKNKEFSIIGDGALFEFTLKPSPTLGGVYRTFLKAKNRLAEIADKFGLEILHSPIASFDADKYFSNMDNELVRASVIAGCDPDMDAIDVAYKSEVRDLTFWPKRGAGGHIHVSVEDYPKLHDHALWVVRLLAMTAGNTYISRVKDVAAEKERQEVFGKPGRFRPQTYPSGTIGIEYRTPSNSWLQDEETSVLMEKAVREAIRLLRNPDEGMPLIKEHLDTTIQAIMEVDQDKSRTVLSALNLA